MTFYRDALVRLVSSGVGTKLGTGQSVPYPSVSS